MLKAILGKKLKMSQVFDEKGKPVPVTVIEAGPCYVTQIKIEENNGYNAIQLGFGQTKKLTKPEENHLKKAGIKKKLKHLKEFRVKDVGTLKTGDKIDISIFKEGDRVAISGISKGKGFAGVIKRHNFSRGPETHGSDHHRHPGSIGSMFPQRVIKGRKMPGHMGHQRVAVKRLKIAKIIPETNIIMLKGAIPGPNKGIIEIQG